MEDVHVPDIVTYKTSFHYSVPTHIWRHSPVPIEILEIIFSRTNSETLEVLVASGLLVEVLDEDTTVGNVDIDYESNYSYFDKYTIELLDRFVYTGY